MKEFDRVEIQAARTLGEADHWFKAHREIAGREETRPTFGEWVKGMVNRMLMRKGEEEL